MKSENIPILLVEDNPGDARLIREMLREPGGEWFMLTQADRLASGLEALQGGRVGLVLLDLTLPDSVGLDTFMRFHARAPEVPIIVLTGTDDEELALNAVKNGAQDYLIKGAVGGGLLLRAMRYALERKRAERALRESEQRYALAALGANDGLWDWDLMSDRVYFSPRWKAMLGFAEAEVGECTEEWLERIHEDDRATFRVHLEHHLEGLTPHLQCEYRMRHRDGEYRWMLCRGIAVRGCEGCAQRMAGSQTDIHERKQAEEQLYHDALHDALTGLPNRVLLMDRLERALERTRREPSAVCAVLFIDLDRFKNVNDSLGHLAGDHLLVECARRLMTDRRPGDTLARLGGDEFILLLEGVSGLEDAVHVVERIQEQFAHAFEILGHDLYMAASIGVAMGSKEYQRPEDLLRDADNAMYQAKARGKACYSVFDASMHTRAVAFLQVETSLRRAIDRQNFLIYYQPVVCLQSGELVGFEALLRWQHAERGLILPADFIPLAEETRLILRIGDWVLREACRQLQAWRRKQAGLERVHIAVNVSSKQFSEENLVARVAGILTETGLPANSLVLEITESVIMENMELAAAKLRELRSLGIRISMDDFGTGYSSLSYLHRFPVDTLKIDQSFVRHMGEAGESVEIVRAILSLARTLHLDVVAEGTETQAQADILQSLGCPHSQGYLYSVPLPKQQASALLRQHGLGRWKH